MLEPPKTSTPAEIYSGPKESSKAPVTDLVPMVDQELDSNVFKDITKQANQNQLNQNSMDDEFQLALEDDLEKAIREREIEVGGGMMMTALPEQEADEGVINTNNFFNGYMEKVAQLQELTKQFNAEIAEIEDSDGSQKKKKKNKAADGAGEEQRRHE